MANFSPSRLGLVNNTGTGYKDLFLKVWSGEVLSAFRKATIFEPLHTVRTIKSGKSLPVERYLDKFSWEITSFLLNKVLMELTTSHCPP